MGRPREFDPNEALEQALQVFWAKGYEAASLTDLTGAMGLSKSSLYETFGSKHELFLATIERYKATTGARLAALLDGEGPAREAIAAVFESVIEDASHGDTRGCFLGNCAAEVAASDPAAAERVRAGLAGLEDAFHAAIARGQAAGEIPAEHDARGLARYLTSSLNGLRLTAKANPDPASLRDVVRLVLAPLD